MKGIRFYEELTNKNKAGETSQGNVLAVFHELGFMGQHGYQYETISALFFEPNSVVCGSAANIDYIRNNCRRISEAKAREIHPELFIRLDN